MMNMKVDQAPIADRAARRPGKHNAVVASDPLASRGNINLCDLPAETGAHREEHKHQGDGFPVVRRRPEELSHMLQRHGTVRNVSASTQRRG
jgi:hypothetical protein